MSGSRTCRWPLFSTAMGGGCGDFSRIPMVPDCLFWPASRPPCLDSGFWFWGKQYREKHEVPDQGSMSDLWEVLLNTTMPQEVLWSYITFHAVSVSSFILVQFSHYVTQQDVYAPFFRSLQQCLSWECSLRLSLFQLQHCMSHIAEQACQDRDWLVEL